MKRNILTACLIVASIQLSGQSILINSHQIRAILKDHAELVELRSIVAVDSAQIQELTQAFYFKDSAYRASVRAGEESDRVAQSYAEMYHESDRSLSGAKKEIRRQKRLKVLFLVAGGLIAVFL